MKLKIAVFVTLIALIALSNLIAAGTSDINRVIEKPVLDESDFAIIDDFMSESITAFLTTDDFASIAKLRTNILSKKSDQGQYAQQFYESAEKYLGEVFNRVQVLRPAERQNRVIINLLILIDGFQDIRLVDFAIDKINNENMAIRYWAVNCLTNSEIINQINSGDQDNTRTAQRIIEQFEGIIQDSSPEIIGLLAKFAEAVNLSEADELLYQIADERISQYADGSVQYELIDSAVLKSLSNKISSANAADVASRFAQLYSYAFQRLATVRQLTETQTQHLIIVLIETEDKCIGTLLAPQTAVRQAIESNDMNALMAEHDRLLGGESTEGQLPSKYNYKYSNDQTSPVSLGS